MLTLVATQWQRALPVLAVLTAAVWLVLFRATPASEQAIFTALLLVYMLHQIEEHLWPGGFRQFANSHVFRSGDDDWPVNRGGIALVNVGFVWMPVAAAALAPATLRWVGLAWIGLTLVNAITHVATSMRFRVNNPGLVTSVVLFLPFTVWALAALHARGALSAGDILLILLLGVVLHIPVAALFAIPYRRGRRLAA